MNEPIKVGDRIRRKQSYLTQEWCRAVKRGKKQPQSHLIVAVANGPNLSFEGIEKNWDRSYFEKVSAKKSQKQPVKSVRKAPFKVGDCILVQDRANKRYQSFRALAVSGDFQAVAFSQMSNGQYLWHNLKDHFRFVEVVP